MNCSSRLIETNTLKLRNGGSPFSRSHCHMVFSSVVSQDIIPKRDSSSSAKSRTKYLARANAPSWFQGGRLKSFYQHRPAEAGLS